jgi:hypothetical protein
LLLLLLLLLLFSLLFSLLLFSLLLLWLLLLLLLLVLVVLVVLVLAVYTACCLVCVRGPNVPVTWVCSRVECIRLGLEDWVAFREYWLDRLQRSTEMAARHFAHVTHAKYFKPWKEQWCVAAAAAAAAAAVAAGALLLL